MIALTDELDCSYRRFRQDIKYVLLAIVSPSVLLVCPVGQIVLLAILFSAGVDRPGYLRCMGNDQAACHRYSASWNLLTLRFRYLRSLQGIRNRGFVWLVTRFTRRVDTTSIHANDTNAQSSKSWMSIASLAFRMGSKTAYQVSAASSS